MEDLLWRYLENRLRESEGWKMKSGQNVVVIGLKTGQHRDVEANVATLQWPFLELQSNVVRLVAYVAT